MDRLPYTYLMIFYCFTFVSIYGKGDGLFPSCEVGLMVRRGTTWKTGPRQSLTVKCPVKHCGESLNVIWCKLVDANHCERINKTENVEIRQNYSVKNELTSYLTFKWISIFDDGLYRCNLKESKYGLISHTINISVSDLNQGVEKLNSKAAEQRSADRKPLFWVPYFCICVSIALLVTILSVLTHLRFYGWKRTLTDKPNNRQEMSTRMIPDLPKRSDPTSPVLQARISVLNDIYCPSAAGTPLSPSSLVTNGNQPLANIRDETQASDCAVYAVINHRQSMLPARKKHTVTKQDKNPEYATISVT